MSRVQHLSVFAATVCALLAFAGVARAGGGNYVFDGGTPAQQSQVRQALNASSFNWSIVPGQITIVIAPTPSAEASPGKIFLDPSLLLMGKFSWGVVQHEYAHQVDFALFDDEDHAQLNTLLGGDAWCYDDEIALQHSEYGCERFASTLAWAYWQSPENSMKPTATSDESAAMAPAAFKALLTRMLGVGTETLRAPTSALVATKTFATRQPATTTTSAEAQPRATVAPAKAVRVNRKTR